MRRLMALSCSAALFLPAAVAGHALAATGDQTPALRVASISPFTDATHPLTLKVQVINTGELALQGARIRITTRSRVSNRSELRSALDRGTRRSQIRSTDEGLEAPVQPGAQVTVEISREAGELGMTRSGVYPIEIALRAGGTLATLYTAVPYFSSPAENRLNIAWVLPVQRPSVVPVDGIYPENTLELLALDELAQQAESIAARPGISVTMTVSGVLLDTLADLADGFGRRTEDGIEALAAESDEARRAATALDAIRRAAASVGELATAPYASANLPSLASHGLGGDILRQVTLGRSVVEAATGVPPSASTFAPTRGLLSRGSLGPLAGVGVTTAVIDQRAFPELPDGSYRLRDFGPSRPIAIRGTTPPVQALMPDPPLVARLDSAEQNVLLAQALVAETASAWHEMPLFAAERVLVIASERIPVPTVLSAALDAFSRAPWVTLRTMTSAVETTPALGDAVALRSFAAPDAPHLAAARAARRALATLQAILAGHLPEADTYERQVLIAESDEWYSNPGTGEAIGRAVASKISGSLGKISVAPERRVTLTASAGEVPVTLVNGNDFPVQVRVRLLSPRLGFPDGTAHTVAPFTGATTVDVPVVARATGSYPVEVRVETPDGRRTLASGRIVLRTTAVSKVTLLAVGGGALLLLLAGLRPGRKGRGRRRRTLVTSPE